MKPESSAGLVDQTLGQGRQLHRRVGRRLVLLLDLEPELFAVDRDRTRRLDAEPDGGAAHLEHLDHDLTPDDHSLAGTTRHTQHAVKLRAWPDRDVSLRVKPRLRPRPPARRAG